MSTPVDKPVPRIASTTLTERYLVKVAKALRVRGLKLVYGMGEVYDWSGKCVGACITHAQDHLGRGEAEKLGTMHLPEGDDFDLAWDAIEIGFDGGPRKIPKSMRTDDGVNYWPRAWWELGRRLRRCLQPGNASKLEAKVRFMSAHDGEQS